MEKSSLHWLAFFIGDLLGEVNKMEEWRDVVGYEKMYQVSNYGRVKSLSRVGDNGHYIKESYLHIRKDKDGYCIVTFFKHGIRKDWKVHRLVAIAFIPNPDNFSYVNHKDEIKSNNYVENLEWCTAAYNTNYGSRNKKVSEKLRGREHPENRGANNYFYGKSFARGKHPQAKRVFQFTVDGVLVGEHDCTISAAESVGVSQSAISMCCRGKRRQIKGYKWSYYNNLYCDEQTGIKQ